MFKINDFHCTSSEDVFKTGENNVGNTFDINVNFNGETIEEVISEAREFFWIDEDVDVERDACGDIGRLDLMRYEDHMGIKAQDDDFKRWRKGNRRLWYAVYTGYVLESQPVSIR